MKGERLLPSWLTRIRPSVLARLYRRFLPYLRPQRGRLSLALVLLIISALMEVLRPLPIKLVLDEVLVAPGSDRVSSFGAWPRAHPVAMIVVSAAAILLTTVIGGFAHYAHVVLAARIGRRVVHGIRLDLFSHLLKLDLLFHRRASLGDLLTRLSSDVRQVKDALVDCTLSSLERGLILSGSVLLIFWLDWRLALFAILLIPALFALILTFSGPMRQAVRKAKRGESRLAGSAAMALTGIEAIQAYQAEKEEVERLAVSSRRDLRAGVKATRLEGRLSRHMELVIASMTCTVLGVGAWFVVEGSLTVGSLMVFLSYLRGMQKPIRSLSRQALRVTKASVCAERILDVLEVRPRIHDAPGAVEAPALRGRITVERVAFSYDGGRDVLRDISLEVPPGTFVALIGASGAGKSTLVRLIARFFDPTEGRVLIDGQDIRGFSLASLRRQIAFSGQEPVLFPVSVRENIALGRGEEVGFEAIRAAARVAGADEFIERLPERYETILGERGATLSGGERRRLDLARIALSRASIVVLDEPTAGLDAASERSVLEALRRTIEGRTTWMITHRLPLLEQADLVLVLEGGRIVEAGSHVVLYEARGRYRRLYDIHEDRPPLTRRGRGRAMGGA